MLGPKLKMAAELLARAFEGLDQAQWQRRWIYNFPRPASPPCSGSGVTPSTKVSTTCATSTQPCGQPPRHPGRLWQHKTCDHTRRCESVGERETDPSGKLRGEPGSGAGKLPPAPRLVSSRLASFSGLSRKVASGVARPATPAPIVVRRAGEPLAAQGDEITRRPGPFVTDEVLEQFECELDVSAHRSATEN